MKAAQINEYGDASVLHINEVNTPVATPGKVVVEVHASSINPFDTIVREGYVKDMMPLTLPATLGGDIAGTVTQIGEGVTGLAIGDKVYGQANAVAGNSGAFAEYASTSAGQIAKSPKNLDFNEAASLPLVGVSALQALNDHIKLTSDHKILIVGGAGGIGSIAIQIAKHIGAYVATTATGEGLETVKLLGADEVIDYQTQHVTELLSDYDAIYDTAGGESFDTTLKVLKTGGVAVTMAAQPNEALANELGITVIAQMTDVTTEKLIELTKLVESDIVKPLANTVFPLDQISEAFTAKETGNVVGKVVISIR
jgi:alcohol dehydrogenase